MRESRVYPCYWNLTSLWSPIGYYELQYFVDLINSASLLLWNLKKVNRSKAAHRLTAG